MRIPFRLVLAATLAYGLVAAAASYVFVLVSGRSVWSLASDQTTSWMYVLPMNLIYWGTWAPLVPLVLRLGHRYPIDRDRWRGTLPLHLAAGLVFVGIHCLFVGSGRFLLQWWFGLSVAWWDSVQQQFLRTFDWEYSFCIGLVGLAHAVNYHGEARRRAVAASQLEARLAEAKLDALRQQLHPHFLFNTLHAISALVHRDPERAELTIERLSDLLRMTLGNAGVQEVPLKEEIGHLAKYVEIEKILFGDRLAVTFDVAPETLDARVPPLILQPLVENAIRHGIAPRAQPGHVRVVSRIEGGRLALRVADNGVGVAAGRLVDLNDGIGLANTRARLQHLYGAAQRLAFARPPAGGLTVDVEIPFRRAWPEAPSRADTLARA